MAAPTFHVKAWAAWAPGRERREDWLDWAENRDDPGEGRPTVGAVPPLLRRRVSPIGQHALRLAWGLEGVGQSRLVFASRHGEFGRTLSIMDALARQADVSPADFSLSVHHALAGLLSIAVGNRRGHTTVAAGRDSFFAAMLEAAAGLDENPGEMVTVVYYDEPLPDPFSDFREVEEENLAIGLALSAWDGPGVRLTPVARKTTTAIAVCPALAFLGFLLSDRTSIEIAGERSSWNWQRTDALA